MRPLLVLLPNLAFNPRHHSWIMPDSHTRVPLLRVSYAIVLALVKGTLSDRTMLDGIELNWGEPLLFRLGIGVFSDFL
jgi:hypothetical protein